MYDCVLTISKGYVHLGKISNSAYRKITDYETDKKSIHSNAYPFRFSMGIFRNMGRKHRYNVNKY